MREGLSDEALRAELSDQWQSVLVLRYKTGVVVLGLFTAEAASAHKKVAQHLQQQAAACLRQGLGEQEQEEEMQKFVVLMDKAFPDEDWEDSAISNIPSHGKPGLLKPAPEACFRRAWRSLAAWVREGEHSSLPALGGAELQLTRELSEGVRCKLSSWTASACSARSCSRSTRRTSARAASRRPRPRRRKRSCGLSSGSKKSLCDLLQ